MKDRQYEISFDLKKQESQNAILTVSQITAKIKGLLEGDVGEVCIQGEISGFKPSSAGHFYFSLKDNGALLSCAIFRAAGKVKFELKDGLEVMARGRISVYAPRGNYQLIIESIEPLGHGALQLALEQLKARLSKEGLFDTTRKKKIPLHPSRIAIVTSPTGAALQDMLNVLGRRNAGISILVVPTLVQGDLAPPQIARAIEIVNQFKLADVIVVARGGGSLEDLWCFNDERVVRAVAASRIPTISAVGHEIDFTLCDFAADLRAPTPSAAAELVSCHRMELIEALRTNERRLALAMSARLSRSRSELLSLENRLISPAERFARLRKTLDELSIRMTHVIERTVSLGRSRHQALSGRLEALSPLKVLGRGYTLIQDAATDELIKSAKDATAGREMSVLFHDGKIKAQVLS